MNSGLILSSIGDLIGCSPTDITSASRNRTFSEGRMLATLILYRGGMNDESIAKILNRSRPSVTYIRLTALGRLDYSKYFNNMYKELVFRLKALGEI